MPTGLAPDTFAENAYITVAEYKNAPTSIDYNNLVVGGNSGAQDAELANVILRASSYMNEYLNQNLVANQYVETQRVRMNSMGYIALHPNNFPVVALVDFQYGTDPNSLTTLGDCSKAWFESQQLIIPLSQLSTNYSSQGALAFGAPAAPRQQMFTKYTYVAGFVNTGIVTATATQSTLTVSSGLGIEAGQILRIYDGASSETVIVASTYTTASTTVPLTSALVYSHAAGVAIGNLPTALKQACILITTAFIKVRGDSSMTMSITTSASTAPATGSQRYGNDVSLALDMVNKYRRIR
jgi:hypothetical protein